MDTVLFYLKLGFEHIADIAAYDHILFLVALCAVYKSQEWRTILWLVTAFTLGHCITLILVSFEVITIPSKTIKILIPLTIILTAIHNVIKTKMIAATINMKIKYAMALFFGLIHGMDFSNYFKALLMDPEDVILPLLGFNVGIELGQLLIVACIMVVAFVFLSVLKIKSREWNLFVSGAAAGMALLSILEITA